MPCVHPLLIAAALLLTTSASAEVFVSNTGFVHFNLIRGNRSSTVDADLHVSANGVWAKGGLRRTATRADFQPLVVTVLHEPYEVQDALGGKWRMWVRSAVGRMIEIELIRDEPTRRASFPVQNFRAVSVTILGAPAAPTFSKLTLFPDGRYKLGGAQGRYQRDEGGLTLDGVPAYWGRATFTLDGDGLVFRFLRGPLEYEVRYQAEPANASNS